jgi:hypothetical protein
VIRVGSEWDEFVAGEKAAANVFELKPLVPKKPSEKSKLEENFRAQIKAAKLPAFVEQHQFAREFKRLWKFDFAFTWPNAWRVAVEIEGLVMRKDPKTGLWQMGGRHGNIAGFEEDCIKYNTAALLGWTVLRFTGSQVKAKSGYAIGLTTRVLYRHGWRPQGSANDGARLTSKELAEANDIVFNDEPETPRSPSSGEVKQ